MGRLGIEIAPRIAFPSACHAVRVRHDAVNEIVLVETMPLWASPYDERAWHVIAVHSTRNAAEVPLDVHVLRSLLRVPPSWASCAAFASAFSLMLLHASVVHRRRAKGLEGLVDAVHEGDGWFTVADGRRFRVPSAGDLELGAFGVRIAEPSLPADYRASAAATIEPVEPGNPSASIARARDLVGSYESAALFAALAGAMPAFVALVVVMS